MAIQADFQLVDEVKIKYPKKYKVFILNDDYTSMEFVVDILMHIFHKSHSEAEKTMLEVHQVERGLCGVYSHEVAETKVREVSQKARKNGFPLKAMMEGE